MSGGSPNDIADLYARYGPMVYRRILHFVRRDEAEEVLHEVFLQVIEKIDAFRADASPSTWLYKIATNHCINRIRNRSRRASLWQEHSGDLWYSAAQGADQEQRAFLRQLFAKLPEDLVRIGMYYHVDGLSHAEIARIEGVSRRTVGNRLDELSRRAKAHASATPNAAEDAA